MFYVHSVGVVKENKFIKCRGEFRPRQTRQLPRAADLKGAASKLSKLLITTTPFHSLTERYSMNVDGNFN